MKENFHFMHKEDCFIDRDNEFVGLFGNEGDLIHCFGNEWTDEQIWTALEFANKMFDFGTKVGKHMKTEEIRKALEIKE